MPATTVYTSLLLLIDFYISILERMTFTFTKLRNVLLPMINAEVERLTSDIDYFEAGEGEEREVVQLRLVSTAHEQHLLL